jgi:hypothetical protein
MKERPTEPDYKELSRGVSTDMSPEAIARRLQIAGELYELVKALERAERVNGPKRDEGVDQVARK